MIHRMDPPVDPDREPMPEHLVPMLAKPGQLPRDEKLWSFEIKWDGIRAIAYSQPGRWRMEGRRLTDITSKYPELRPLGRELGSRSAVLDGEIVAFGEDGRPSFERLQHRMHLTGESRIKRQAQAIPASYLIFDLLHLDGHSLMDRPYEERRARLEELELNDTSWRTPAAHRGAGTQLLRASNEQGLEGVVAKRLDSPYEPGRRSGAWVKINPGEIVIGEEESRVDSGEGPAALAGETPAAADTSLGPMRELRGGAAEVTIDGRDLRLSNLDKVMYPKAGFAKGQLVDYYARISPALLPHLHGRPLTMKRYPDGVEGQFFYEKQCPSHRPDWVETASIWSRHNKRNIDFCLVNDLPTLVWAANLADLELHTSLSLASAIDRPTMMVFDLDPGAPATIVDCCKVGLRVRELFEGLGLETFAKTSGSKGLQVYVPLNVEVTYAQTKPFAKAVAELLEKQHPKLVVSRMTKSLRRGKVLVDWSQNDDHKTTVCVYSLRAKERPTVSTPVTWQELEKIARSGNNDALVFDSDAVLKRVEKQGDLFEPVLTLKQELPKLEEAGLGP